MQKLRYRMTPRLKRPLRLQPLDTTSIHRLRNLRKPAARNKYHAVQSKNEDHFALEVAALMQALQHDPSHTGGWEIRHGRRTIGAVGLLSCRAGYGQFGYMVHPKWQGRGIGSCAAREAVRLLHLARSLRCLITLSRTTAQSSNAILLRCGFRNLGRWPHDGPPAPGNQTYWYWRLQLRK